MPIEKGKSRYKHGKILETLSFEQIQEKIRKARNKITIEAEGFFWLLYYSGCRKSEAYERVAGDVEISKDTFKINFHKRKKGGAEVPALKLPRNFPGVETLCQLTEKAQNKKPNWKQIQRNLEKGKTTAERMKAHWIFPHINRAWSLVIVKKILGQNYYPHFLRLNRITELCGDPEMSLTRLRSFTGLKSLDALQSYLGVSEREQDAALSYMAKQIKSEKK